MFARPLMRRQWRLASVVPASPMVTWNRGPGRSNPALL
jgi:hypothetical protein